jgi:hypothetical protein
VDHLAPLLPLASACLLLPWWHGCQLMMFKGLPAAL